MDAVRANTRTNKVPENIRIPEPRVLKRKAGTLYAFDLPKEWGLDKRILPNAGLVRQRGGRVDHLEAQPAAIGRQAADRSAGSRFRPASPWPGRASSTSPG